MNLKDTLAQLRTERLDLIEYFCKIFNCIEAKEPDILALVPGTYDRKRTLAEGRRLQETYPDPAVRPPLFGLPVGVKDIFRVDGFPTRCGSRLPEALFEGEEASCVTAFKRAGAIVVGKTVTTEFAYSEPGPTRNPHDLTRTPGGSSSGSAAGVACGFFPAALGTQTVGSVIRPAAYCGVIGFKPSVGRISKEGVIPFSPTADHVGVFCKGVGDLEILLPVLVEGWQPDQPLSITPVLGVPQGAYLEQASKNALAHFERTLVRLREAGIEARHVPVFGDIERINADHQRLIAGEKARVHEAWFATYRDRYRPRTAALIEEGSKISAAELDDLRQAGEALRDAIEARMDEAGIDAWVCPAAQDHAPRGLNSTGSPLMNLPWTAAGLPALSVPSGLDEVGLPHGLQLVGRLGGDERLVTLAQGGLAVASKPA